MIGLGMLVGKFELKPPKETNLGVTRGIFHSKKILLKTEWAETEPYKGNKSDL